MKKILVLGDVMLDKYSYGEVRRLNPEGPNPLLKIIYENYVLGGAGNVSANIASLYGNCDLIGMVGEDFHFQKMKELCRENNINFYPVKKNIKTITKQRFIEKTYKQQLLRVDYEEIHSLTDIEIREIVEYIKNQNYDILVVSDYAKGMISEKLIAALKNEKITILADVKPKNYKYFSGVQLLKPNFKEFCEMIENQIDNSDSEIEKFGKIFVKDMNINIVITRGEKGATLITKDGNCLHIPTEAKDVFDVTGAGDTFLSAVAYALLQDESLENAIVLGNKASGIIVGKVGTAIISYSELFEGKK